MGDAADDAQRRAEQELEDVEGTARQLPAVRASEAVVAQSEITVQQLLQQADKVKQVMTEAMREGVHYGKIPGVQKPTLLKPGAEMLCVLLRLAPSYDSERTFHDDGHLTVISKCTLTHITSSYVIAEGEGLCTSRETKYAYRQGKRVCPSCGQEAIVRSTRKKAYFCISAEGGCGNRYGFGTDQAVQIDKQDTGRVPNPELPDTFNTVLKMADKRALVAAVLVGTAASDVFTQDVEDTSGDPYGGAEEPPEPSEPDRPFDPGRDSLPGAISGQDALSRIGEALKHIGPDVDWKALLGQLEGERDPVFWRRLANVIARLQDGSDFPPPDDAAVVEAFAWGFEGAVIVVPRLEKEEFEPPAPVQGPVPEPDESIPFGGGAYRDE